LELKTKQAEEMKMARTITTINDLKNIVDGWLGSDYWTADPKDHPAAVETIARTISSRAHADGLRYGQDWSEYLEGISSEDCHAMLND
jgi:hypothetical protein